MVCQVWFYVSPPQAQALDTCSSRSQLTLLCLVRSTPPSASCDTSAGFAPALCKSLVAEAHALSRAALVQLPPDSLASEVASCLLAEAGGGSALDVEVSHDAQGRRFVRRLISIGDSISQEAMLASGSFFSLVGLYIVSGGLGGIGSHVVQMLIEDLPPDAHILVVGRRPAAQAAEQLRGWGDRVSYAALDLGRDLDARTRVGKVGSLLLRVSVGRATREGLHAFSPRRSALQSILRVAV